MDGVMLYGIEESHSCGRLLWNSGFVRLACFVLMYCIICFMTLTSASSTPKRWGPYSVIHSANLAQWEWTYLNNRFNKQNCSNFHSVSFIFSLFIQQQTGDLLWMHTVFQCKNLFFSTNKTTRRKTVAHFVTANSFMSCSVCEWQRNRRNKKKREKEEAEEV